MQPADLESIVQRELERLPLPRAPRTLLPRVMAAVDAWTHRPWYAREWLTWPRGWQALSIVALAVVVAAGWVALPQAMDAASAWVPHALTPGLGGAASTAARAAAAAGIVWRTLLQPLVPYAFGFVMLMCVACAASAIALNHAVFGRTVQS
jgi:hypothetical protein